MQMNKDLGGSILALPGLLVKWGGLLFSVCWKKSYFVISDHFPNIYWIFQQLSTRRNTKSKFFTDQLVNTIFLAVQICDYSVVCRT